MKPLIAIVVGAALCCVGPLHPRLAAAAVCGDGILDPNEECDPGGGLHAFGDPSQETCGFGGSSIPGSECFFDLLQVQLPVCQSGALLRRQPVHDERPVRQRGPLQRGHGRGERHRLRRSHVDGM
jgi:hypothetical protein